MDKTTAALFSAIAVLGGLPLITAIADLEEETQALIRTTSWGLAATVAIAGAFREESPELLKARILEDGKKNSELRLQRLKNMNYHDAEVLRLDLAGELQRARIAQLAGSMGLSYMPQGLQRFTPNGQVGYPQVTNPQIIDAQVVDSQGITANKQPAIKPGSIAMPPGVLTSTPQSEFSPEYIKAAYQYLLSLNGRNTLNMLIYGRTGDTKTSFLHRMFYEKLLLEPDSILLICDRKNMSAGKPGTEQWQSNWFGAPVYPDAGGKNSIEIIKKSDVPFTHVYASVAPRLDIWFKWIYEYVEKWRLSGRVDDDGEFVEMTVEERRKDPLWSHTYDRPRAIYVIADDGTSILGDLDPTQRKVANDYLSKLCTLGRSENVHIFWCAHSNTQTDIGLSGPSLDSMAIVQGSGFSENALRLQYNRETVIPEGIERAAKDKDSKAKGFATSFPKFPYIPPSELDEAEGLRAFILPDIAIEWLQNIPVPHYLKPWHKEILAAKGFVYQKGVGVIPATAPAQDVSEDSESYDQVALLCYLRDRYRYRDFSDAEILQAISDFGVSVDLSNKLQQIRNAIALPDAVFAQLISG